MKTLYFDCSCGAAGDMIVASLLSLLPNPDDFILSFNGLLQKLKNSSIQLSMDTINRCGLQGLQVHMNLMTSHSQTWTQESPCECLSHDHEHSCEHDHEHSCGHDHKHDHEHSCEHDHDHHHHHGMTMTDIESVLETLPISESCRQHALAIFHLIAEAESRVHGRPVDQIHFHEVGQLDAIADILATCLLIESLHPDQILASPICTGKGFVRCTHGLLPIPAPATCQLLIGIPCYQGAIDSEMCTPTGAAILKHFVQHFGDMPHLTPERIGSGFGTRTFPDFPNMLRTFWGTQPDSIAQTPEYLAELHVNVDDMTGEQMAYAVQMLMNAGARDAWTYPIYMKKGRPAHTIACLVLANQAPEFAKCMLQYTSSLGVRIFPCQRISLDRTIETVQTEFGPIRRKTSTFSGIERHKWECDDLVRAAQKHHLSLADFVQWLEKSSQPSE